MTLRDLLHWPLALVLTGLVLPGAAIAQDDADVTGEEDEEEKPEKDEIPL